MLGDRMHYLGSKARHAADIISITTANRRVDQIYVEPFVGGGNVINKVPQGAGRIANDKNVGMVSLLHALGNLGWTPPETMSKAEWQRIMKKAPVLAKLPTLEQAEFAFAATGPTFGSMWCGQWAKDYPGMEGTRYRQARDAALKDAPGLKGIEFHSGSYSDLVFPDESLIYCDPPYVGTTDYAGSKTKIVVGESLGANTWKAGPFWKWADDLVVKRGCTVFVSEYKGPAPSAFSFEPSDEWKAKKAAFLALPKLDPADASIPSSAFEERRLQGAALDEERSEEAARYAAKWEVLWEKEVVSDFSASRGKEGAENAAKKETEKLFGRRP
jgi:DNA adenine methylase